MFGLKHRDIENIQKALNMFPNITAAIIFGSRAMGNYKSTSDIDIAVQLNDKDPNTIIKLSGILNEELPIPFFVDVINVDTIKNKQLIEHISNEGKKLPLKTDNLLTTHHH
jgi:uncharacterized protein